MNVLDSPMEALAFNYLSFGFFTVLNNLWTWVAVVTAAVSFWRIRAAGCPKPELQPPSDDPTCSTVPDPVPELEMLPHAVTPVTERPPQTVVGGYDADVDGVRKGKFTVYYEDDIQCGESEELLRVAEEWEEREGELSEWWESWERLARMRKGENENGWYTCQDLMVLNGNVVRLWDGRLRLGNFTRESWYGSSCIHVW